MNITISRKSIIATVAGIGISIGIAGATFVGLTAGASAITEEFTTQWEADAIAADEMFVEAQGQMITFIDKDANTEVVYYTTQKGGGISRTEMTSPTSGSSSIVLEDAEGARFGISPDTISVKVPEVGTFEVARAPQEA